ncbi:peptidyl-prolyl cis-trans isomerase B (cyclophilin B) [Nakamurella panacisegetis]|uniref:Peptidyl-prolyl cis-trans isomerase B (Cyclophilin B) n=1 Tax=Nakamurella panacisegetis TaxID=1090615 RepID=A0A1H0QW73_9ACTN|nr:peptidyl-prolyl cis-trans isomerase B (cyclophilin B) [Nakamurella panacisegetis]
MPSNQQRREAAKRKLERQLVRREERERGRRQRLIVIGVVATVLVVAGGIWYATTRPKSSTAASDTTSTGTQTAATTSAPKTPCTYTTSGKAAKTVNKPSNTSPANTGTVDATIKLNGQDVPITLDRAAAPCTVNSFVSLASQKFYDNSPCWRLTGNSALNILQCGDPTGVGNGGPGYTFADELTKTKTYPKGTIAMANSYDANQQSGENTNGSQFFIVYKDSTLSPHYTVFGKVSDAGMAVIDAIAAKGVKNNAQDGAPVAKAVIDSVTVPADSVTATGSYASSATATAAAAGGAGGATTAAAATASTSASSSK